MIQTFQIGEKTIRRLGFGAMRLPAQPAAARERSVALVRRALELGVDLIDTAFMYGWGDNELLLAEALHPYPAGLLIATKVGIVQPRPGEWSVCGKPESLRRQVEESLRRLRLECIELLQLHRLDPDVPLADQIGALTDLKRAGKIVNLGLSEVTLSELDEAASMTAIASVQNQYSLFQRRWESVLERCAERGIAFLPWRPVAPNAGESPLSVEVERLASELGATRAQVALAWLLHHSPVILPIPGTSQLAHLEENMAAARLVLGAEQLQRLNGQ
jgi:aryl-alcohol dehydrogenase-like predicted oxidoreductase